MENTIKRDKISRNFKKDIYNYLHYDIPMLFWRLMVYMYFTKRQIHKNVHLYNQLCDVSLHVYTVGKHFLTFKISKNSIF